MGETEIPAPVTPRVTPRVPLKITEPPNRPVEVGLKRTVTRWLWPADREYAPPETTWNGASAVAFPPTATLPTFCTVKVRSSELPTGTSPKSRELGVTSIVGVKSVVVHTSDVLSPSV